MEDGLDVDAALASRPRKSRKKAIWAAVCLLALFWVFVGDPPFYFSKTLHGRVVDSEDGHPLAGAIVLAEWQLEPQVFGNRSFVPLYREEVVTNANGEFEIAGWGPKARPPGWALGYMSPKIFYAYPHYYVDQRSNDVFSDANRDRSIVRTSKWDRETIRLTRFDGDWKRYWSAFRSSWSRIWSCTRDCPRFLAIVVSESQFISEGAPKDLQLFPIVSLDTLDPDVRKAIREVNEHVR